MRFLKNGGWRISGRSQPDPNGGGNFDTLEGEKDLGTDISIMLLSKCIASCQYFHAGRLVVRLFGRTVTKQSIAD
jgi:hypothetical protein